MTTDEEIQNALLGIYSRLGTVEGKVTLVARAERERLLPVLEPAIRKRPLVGQVYLVLHKALTQDGIREELARVGVDKSQPTISRALTLLQTELGMIEVLPRTGRATTYRRNRVMEETLNLSKRVREWLEDENQAVPEQPSRRRGGRRSK